MKHEKYLAMAIDLARNGMRSGDGGPFGAVIVQAGEIIGRGHNQVLANHDPTAHAEVMAIRDACRRLGKHHLSDAVLYTNFEPCPMCLAAAYWADIRKLYYCASKKQAEMAGFMDRHLYGEIALDAPQRELKSLHINMIEMDELLEEWNKKEDKTLY